MRFLITLLLSASTLGLLAQRDSTVFSIDLDDVVVTGQYAPTEARNALHKVTVLTREEWQTQGLNNLAELLQRQMTLGVSPDPILGSGLTIQGMGGQNVQIMIDGVPVIGRLGGNIDLNQLDLASFARVEVIAGAMSARYGSDAAGGVINLITAKEQAGAWKLEAGGQYERVDLDRQYLRAGRQLGDLQVDGGVNHYRARFGSVDSLRTGSIPWNPKQQLGYDANLRYRPGDSLQIHYGYRSFDETLTMYGPVRRPQFRPYVQDQIFTTSRQDHSLCANYWISPAISADLTAGWNRFDRLKATERRDLEPDTTRLVVGGQDTTRYTAQLLRLSVAAVGHPRWSGQFGLEYLRESGSGGRILDPLTGSRTPTLENLASWLGFRYRVANEWSVESTARIGHNSRYDHPVVPALHVLWRPTEQWRWRLGYAWGFRAPSVQELFFNFIDVNHFIIGNPALAAERSRNARLQGEWLGGKSGVLSLNGELFLNQVKNRITLADVADGQFSYVNLATYATQGATLQAVYQPSANWSFTTGAALTRLQNPAENEETELPRFTTLGEVRNELSFRLPQQHFTFRIDHRYVGRQDRYLVAADGSISQGYIGDYHLLHLTLNKGFLQERVWLSLGAKNLLNRDRVPVTGGEGGGAHSGGSGGQLIDFGRSWFVNASFSW
ncbi:TonB-dependent receptor [Neolewinella lacunae]|uniref:TonB-dependent receptor n=1 Tax=Neolewinella lacunae TaxID=1517758 RepID=A0A923PF81_9BACT|nr:TonB-dependent receptor [Neolewinella lacunae]MBC6992985.1 TonB-dependent receptor [Neolewinella lacunae]MDN3635775.1 TonB-dependent receptor [Neolewinella lacunae]